MAPCSQAILAIAVRLLLLVQWQLPEGNEEELSVGADSWCASGAWTCSAKQQEKVQAASCYDQPAKLWVSSSSSQGARGKWGKHFGKKFPSCTNFFESSSKPVDGYFEYWVASCHLERYFSKNDLYLWFWATYPLIPCSKAIICLLCGGELSRTGPFSFVTSCFITAFHYSIDHNQDFSFTSYQDAPFFLLNWGCSVYSKCMLNTIQNLGCRSRDVCGQASLKGETKADYRS